VQGLYERSHRARHVVALIAELLRGLPTFRGDADRMRRGFR
jgi:hypothetical protein